MTECNSSHDNRPKINHCLNQAGIIILFKSGVIYQNQTCGTACIQRCEEGVLLLPTDPLLITTTPVTLYQCPIDAALRQMEWFSLGINEKRADQIDALLSAWGWTSGISVDMTRLHDSEEAWVYVNIEPVEYGVYSGFGSCKGVLVWQNSD